VNVRRFSGVHPETALTAAVQKFERRFRRMEALVADSGGDLESLPQSEKDRIWEAVNQRRPDALAPRAVGFENGSVAGLTSMIAIIDYKAGNSPAWRAP